MTKSRKGKRSVGMLAGLCAAMLAARAAAAEPVAVPDTPAGAIGGALLQHINGGRPDDVRHWAPTILSPSIAGTDRSDFVTAIASAARDSGGVELVRADNDAHSGLLVLTLRARGTGRQGMLVLAADPAHPGTLAQASLVPLDDPALYDGWPAGATSMGEIAGPNWPSAPVPNDEIVRLSRLTLDRLAQTTGFSGCLTIFDGHRTILDECRGLAERNFGIAADSHTRFHLASISKTFTAVGIAQLVESGRLSWDATLADLVPEYPDREAARHITVWQLLHHTAALGDYLVPEFFRDRAHYVNPVDYLDLIARQPRVGQPGEWNYSNAGFVLLGRIIENVSHENYFDYIQRHVFAPAGMTDSGFDSIEDATPNLAVGYFRDGPFSATWKANWMSLPFKGSPAGGAYATNADMLRFARALREGRLVRPATLQAMFENEVPAGPGAYAAGFGDRLSHGRHIRGHAGGAPGMDTDLAIVWETGASVIINSNQGESSTAMLLAERIADMLAADGATQ